MRSEDSQLDKEHEAQNILELDWTHLDIYALQEKLTLKIAEGSLLHGSNNGDISQLEPHYARDGFSHKGEATAVFATDNPLIALARGVAGKNLIGWTGHIFFDVQSIKHSSLPGFIYLVPNEVFEPHIGDDSEYLSYVSVVPSTRIKVSYEAVSSIFRTHDEHLEVINKETGLVMPEKIRASDIDVSLLTLKTALELSDIMDYDTNPNSKGFNRFIRLSNYSQSLTPVISRIREMATPKQKNLARQVYKRWELVSYGIYQAPPMALSSYLAVRDMMDSLKEI